MNPIFPPTICIPDGEAHVMPDGRLYLYGSTDIYGGKSWCSDRYSVFSTDDMEHWVDHGISFQSGRPDMHAERVNLAAPDCIHKNGKYYLCYDFGDGREYIAVSDRPEGPFLHGQPVTHADGGGIDPAIFVDDDGDVYYFWGQFHLKGARMLPDMHTLDASTIDHDMLSEQEHGFHEGSSIRKRNGIYYLVYCDISRGRATCLAYATSRRPLGPYTKQGILVDNIGCEGVSWNNHGSIECFKGQWYVFYHRCSQGGLASRRACCEKIAFDENGRIAEVPMTSQGASGPIRAADGVEARYACRMTTPYCNGAPGIRTGPAEDGEEALTHTKTEDWACYRYLDLGPGASEFSVLAASENPCTLEIRAEGGTILGQCEIVPTGGFGQWKTFTCGLKPLAGVHAIWLTLRSHAPWAVYYLSDRLADIKRFRLA